MDKPSSTIQAASLTGLGMTVLWLIIPEFTGYEVPPQIVAATTAFVMAFVGYIKKEKILKARWLS
jgi:hypothetical protein